MFWLISNINNLYLKNYTQAEILEQEMTQVTSKEYDEKLYQVKITIANSTDLRLKVFKILTSHRINFGIADEYVMKL